MANVVRNLTSKQLVWRVPPSSQNLYPRELLPYPTACRPCQTRGKRLRGPPRRAGLRGRRTADPRRPMPPPTPWRARKKVQARAPRPPRRPPAPARLRARAPRAAAGRAVPRGPARPTTARRGALSQANARRASARRCGRCAPPRPAVLRLRLNASAQCRCSLLARCPAAAARAARPNPAGDQAAPGRGRAVGLRGRRLRRRHSGRRPRQETGFAAAAASSAGPTGVPPCVYEKVKDARDNA